LRVTGGIGRGRRLKVPAGGRVRPTSDKVKQALFNILGASVEDAVFLDLFAGAGGIGIEALSRGAGRVVFVDASRGSLAAVRRNIEDMELEAKAVIVSSRAETFLKKPSGPYDIVFLDPPYDRDLCPLLELVANAGLLKPEAVVVAEHAKKQPSPERAGNLALHRESVYGDTVLAFYTYVNNTSQKPEVRHHEAKRGI
jgi:16S rRNA (guanine(966)-N(2))-methyltransferase RsmD